MKNKFLAFLLSLAVAFGLWLFVITVVSPESEKTYFDIPVVLQNKEVLSQRGLMIVSETPKVTLALKSDRSTLNDLNEANINVIVNLSNIEKSGTHNLTYTIAYPGNIPAGSISVQSSSTDLITLKVENRITKTVPIVVIPKKNTDGTDSALPQDYITDLQKAQLTTQEDNQPVAITGVEISGPQSVIDQIQKAVIDVDLNNQTKTFSQNEIYTLCNEEGKAVNAEKVTTDVDVVEVTVKVQKVKEITLAVDVIPGAGATTENSTVTLSPSKIWIAGDEELVDSIPATLDIGDVKLGSYLEDTSFTIDIKGLLQGAENRTGVDEITVDVKFTGLQVSTFNVTAITPQNVPEGLQVEIIDGFLPVTVRGPAAEVGKMTADNMSVQVDCSNIRIDDRTMQVVVTSPAGVVPVGTYQVAVKVTEVVEQEQSDAPVLP